MRRPIAIGSALAAALAGTVACTSGPAANDATPVPPCQVSAVHHSHPPAGVPGFAPDSTGVPWTGDDHFAAVLFYARGNSSDIPVGGRWADGDGVSKILWWADGATERLHVHGRESASAGQFTQSFPTTGEGQYPTTVIVPESGCWTLDATVADRKVGTITVRAVAQ